MSEDPSIRAIDLVMQHMRHDVLKWVTPDHVRLTATNDRLVQFESEIGYGLPADFRYFIGRYGGASLHEHVVVRALDPRADREEDLFSVSLFFGFYSDGIAGNCPYDLVHNYQVLKDLVPRGMVPFAESGENRFCIACRPDHKGDVYCWIPGDFADDEATLYFITDTFTEFMQALRVLHE